MAACGGGGSDAPEADAAAAAAGSGRSPAQLTSRSTVLTPAPAGLSGNVTCLNMQIDVIAVDSVIVPADAACTLVGTRLNGNIIVGTGATLVGGSVQIKQGGSARVDGIRIGGDLQIDTMRGQVTATANRLGGSMQLVGNLGGVALIANRLDGALQCKDKLTAPTGSANVASIKEDQCRGL